MRIGISRFSQTTEEAYEVLSAAQRYGFESVQLKPSQYGEFVDSPALFEQCYGPLASLSCGGLVVYPGGEPSTWIEQAKKVLPFTSAIGERARQQNLVISIHNHVGSLAESEEDIAGLLEKLDPQICGLTLDTAHAAKAGITQVERLAVRFQRHLLNADANQNHLNKTMHLTAFCL